MVDSSNRNVLALESLIILIWYHNIQDYFIDDELLDNDGYYDCRRGMEYIGGNTNYWIPLDNYPATKLPDICGSCLTYFGHTYGGNLRHGCHVCRDSTTANNRIVEFNRVIRAYMYQNRNVFAYVASVLYKYNLIGEDVS